MEKITYNICYNAAKQCETLCEFRTKFYSYYIKSFKQKWINDFNWLITYGYKWTEKTTFIEAKKYEYLSDFKKYSGGAYKAAKKHDWLKNFIWLKKKVYTNDDKVWCVYVYEFSNNLVYIGLTIDIKRRHYEHKTKIVKDSLAKYCNEHKLILPDYIIKYKNLDSKKAQYYEDYLKKQYKKENWELINKGSTGINTGSLGNALIKWDKQSVFNAAKECSYRKELKLKYPRAYYIALTNNWLEQFTWFNTKYKKIYQFDENYNQINVYENLNNVISSLKIKTKRNIKQALYKHIKAYGFYWSYNSEFIKN